MKRLWKYIPPVMSDVMGFEAVMNVTEGVGIIDDSSTYKPVTAGRGGGTRGGDRGGFGGHGGEPGDRGSFGGHGRDSGGHGDFGRRGFEGGRPPEMRGGWGGERGERGGRGGRRGNLRVVDSEIRNEDIITGTEKKVMQAFYDANDAMQPKFVLLCHAPSSSMIGSDLAGNAERITAESGVPAAYVNVDGAKDYLYGVSATLETMGKLLLSERETIPNTVNILGANPIDWTEDALKATEDWLTENGFTVLSRWGMKDTAENLRNAAAASVNLVVSAAGMRLARYMETQFGVPYVVGAPFGKDNAARLIAALRGEKENPAAAGDAEPEVLIVAEQLCADALRRALEAKGYKNIRCASLFETDKALLRTGDLKLQSEDALKEELTRASVKLVFCDPDAEPLCTREVKWIKLPNPASHNVFEAIDARDFTGEKLDNWLAEVLG